jgi:Zinc carboxypeptidase
MPLMIHRRLAFPCAAVLFSAAAASGQPHDFDALTKTLETTVASHSGAATLSTYGASRLGKPLWVLTLASTGTVAADERTALLLVAGLDGDRLAGGEVALLLADKVLSRLAGGDESVSSLLREHTLYIIPRANPDAQEMYFAPTRSHWVNAMRPVDDDRDGEIDEDGPDDINGDGLITTMRVRDLEATYLEDSDEPRLLRKADRNKGERPQYKVYVEGIDNDGDGEYNEDPAGGVDLNANFPHEYPEHGPNAGPYQLSEPESRALADFVLSHPRIAMAVTLGRHNNLIKIGDGKKKDASGKAPADLHEDDVAIYKFIGERYKELTAIEKAPSPPAGGAFYAWLYAQYGIPSFATSVWHRPESDDKKDSPESDTKTDDKDEAGSKETADDEKDKNDKKDKKEKKVDKGEEFKEALAWLKYSDDARDGAGFVEWTAVTHPTLGEVEVGGFVPYFKTIPPPEELDALAEAQTNFVLDLAGRFPEIEVGGIEVIRRDETVYEIKAFLVNDGLFPTGLAIAKVNRRVRPVVVTMDLDADRILGGKRVQKIWSIAGSGGAHELRWIVRGNKGEVVTFRVTSEKYGDFAQPIPLTSTESKGGQR